MGRSVDPCLTFKPTGTLNVIVFTVRGGHACGFGLLLCRLADNVTAEGVFGCCGVRAADSHPDDPPFIFPFFGSNERRAVSIPHPADQMILSSVHSESV